MGRMTSHILWKVKNVPNHQLVVYSRMYPTLSHFFRSRSSELHSHGRATGLRAAWAPPHSSGRRCPAGASVWIWVDAPRAPNVSSPGLLGPPKNMGVSENNVPLKPMVHDHYPVFKWLSLGIYPIFRHTKNMFFVRFLVVCFTRRTVANWDFRWIYSKLNGFINQQTNRTWGGHSCESIALKTSNPSEASHLDELKY